MAGAGSRIPAASLSGRRAFGLAAVALLLAYAAVVAIAASRGPAQQVPLRDAAFLLPLPVGYLIAWAADIAGRRFVPVWFQAEPWTATTTVRVVTKLGFATSLGALAGLSALPIKPWDPTAGSQGPIGLLGPLPMVLVGPLLALAGGLLCSRWSEPDWWSFTPARSP